MKNFASILKSLVILVILGMMLMVGYFFWPKPEAPPTVVTNNIESTISDIGELATSEYRYTISQTAEKPAHEIIGFEIPATRSHVFYSYQGVIKAGIQFGEITIHVNETNKTVYVQLPEAEILSEEVFHDSLVIFDEQYSPFNRISFTDMNLSITNLKETAKNDAIKNGLLDAAHDNAVTILKSTVNNFYDPDVYSVEYY